MAVTGSYGIPNSASIIPLCSGWIIYANRVSNTVSEVNVVTGQTGNSYQLSATPELLIFDQADGWVYATLSGADSLAQVNLNTGNVTYISLPAPAVDGAVANSGYLFVSLDSSTDSLMYVNGSTATTVTALSISIGDDSLLGYDKTGNYLYVLPAGCSGCSAVQYSFNAATTALGSPVTGYTTGNGEEVDVSPDNNHVAFVDGGGNGSGYSIDDYNSSNIQSSSGSWNTGAYPNSAGFSPNSQELVATNDTDLEVFSVATHAVTESWQGFTQASYYWMTEARFSRGGGMFFGLEVDSISSSAASTVVWGLFP